MQRIRKEIRLNELVNIMLDNMADHYKLTKSKLIDLLFIIDQDNDRKGISIKSNSLDSVEKRKSVKVFITLSTHNIEDMKSVALSYKLTLSKYIEKLIIKSYNQDYSNKLIETI